MTTLRSCRAGKSLNNALSIARPTAGGSRTGRSWCPCRTARHAVGVFFAEVRDVGDVGVSCFEDLQAEHSQEGGVMWVQGFPRSGEQDLDLRVGMFEGR
jgi:hypothetical protein